jgi:hypothetical protein
MSGETTKPETTTEQPKASPPGGIPTTLAAVGLTALVASAHATPVTTADETLSDPTAEEAQTSTPPAIEFVRAKRRLALETLAPHAERWHYERNQLLRKRYSGGLSEDEERQLAYLHWRLYQIEDAETGPSLDRLEALAELHEQLATTVESIGERAGLRRKRQRR